jgi:hypothetical protein
MGEGPLICVAFASPSVLAATYIHMEPLAFHAMFVTVCQKAPLIEPHQARRCLLTASDPCPRNHTADLILYPFSSTFENSSISHDALPTPPRRHPPLARIRRRVRTLRNIHTYEHHRRRRLRRRQRCDLQRTPRLPRHGASQLNFRQRITQAYNLQVKFCPLENFKMNSQGMKYSIS